MQIVTTTMGQMFILFSLILFGFFLTKIKIMENGSATILSRLENNLLLPALVMSTFVEIHTNQRFGNCGCVYHWIACNATWA